MGPQNDLVNPVVDDGSPEQEPEFQEEAQYPALVVGEGYLEEEGAQDEVGEGWDAELEKFPYGETLPRLDPAPVFPLVPPQPPAP